MPSALLVWRVLRGFTWRTFPLRGWLPKKTLRSSGKKVLASNPFFRGVGAIQKSQQGNDTMYKNGLIIHGDEAPTQVIVKGREAIALLDAHPLSHYNQSHEALIALLNLDDITYALENSTGWESYFIKGYCSALADDSGYDYYSIVVFTNPVITDTQPSLQAEYDTWLKATCPQSMLDDASYEMTAENLMLHTRDGGWVMPDENVHDFWVDYYQVDYLRAFCRRWDVVENYVSDEEYAEETV